MFLPFSFTNTSGDLISQNQPREFVCRFCRFPKTIWESLLWALAFFQKTACREILCRRLLFRLEYKSCTLAEKALFRFWLILRIPFLL